MKKNIKLSAFLLAISSCLVLASCHSGHYRGSVGVGYSNSGYGYYDGVYDSSGFPIFGYYGGRPVYGYNSYGSPIFSFSYINSRCYVPSWGPAPYYKGHYHYPRGIHRSHRPPHYDKGWKAPNFDKNRPSFNNRPQRPNNSWGNHNSSGNNHGIGRPSHNNNYVNIPGKRPDNNSSSIIRPNRPSYNNNRPGYNTNRPSNNYRPGNNNSIIRPDRPNSGSSINRPGNSNIGGSRPSRPSFGSESGRPSHSGGSSINRPSRPDSSSMNRPSRPSGSSMTRPSRPSGSGGSPSMTRPSRPSGGSSSQGGRRGGRGSEGII